MALEQYLFMETPALRQELRDALVRAGIGLEAQPDYKHVSQAMSKATLVSLVQSDDPVRPWTPNMRHDNGIFANRMLCFRCRDHELGAHYEAETVRGVMALIKAYPEADGYLQIYDAAIPALLYQDGRLILAERLTRDRELWDEEHQPYRRLVDLPYVVEPLGPWRDVPVEAERSGDGPT